MANGPSNNALSNRVDLYRYIPAQDVDAGEDNISHFPTAFATNVPASVQLIDSQQSMTDDDRRPTTVNTWHVYFRVDYALKLKDLIVWTDTAGIAHRMQVDGSRDGAGKGRNIEVPATERL